MVEFLKRWEMFKEGVSLDLENELKRISPVDNGRLKASIRVKPKGDTLLISMVDYALYVEFGTKPHIIKAKNAKALHWKQGAVGSRGGKKEVDRFAKQVRHPGTKPQPFIRNTFYHKLKAIIEINAERYVPEIAEHIEVNIG